jgi:YD repeat-containing protein
LPAVRILETRYGYDSLGRQVAFTEAVGLSSLQRSTSMAYDAADHLVSLTRPQGYDSDANAVRVRTDYRYDALGRRTATVEAANFPTTFARTTTMAYDAADHVVDTTQPLVYDYQQGLPSSPDLPDVRRVETRYAFDPLGRQVAVTEAVGLSGLQRSTSMAYDAADNLVSITKPQGYDPDSQGLPNPNPVRVRTDYQYDRLNRRTATIEAANFYAFQRTTQTAYDAADHVIWVMQPRAYDNEPAGDPFLPAGPRTVTTFNAYDALGRQVQVTQAVGLAGLQRTSLMAYDAADNLLSQTQPQTYDLYPAGQTAPTPVQITTSYGYDVYNRQTQLIEDYGDNAAGGLQRTTSTSFPAGISIIVIARPRGYDNAATLAGLLTGPATVTTRQVYDALHRLVSVTEAVGQAGLQRTTLSTYDAADNVTSVSKPSSLGGYDLDGNGNTVATPTRVLTRYGYDPFNHPVSMVEAVGVAGQQRTTTMAYDAAGNLVQQTRPQGQGSDPNAQGYDLNAQGQNVSAQATRVTTLYRYDALGRRTAEVDAWRVNGQPSPLQRTTTTAYDAANNVVGLTQPRAYDNQASNDPLLPAGAPRVSTRYDFDPLNRQIRVTDPLGHATAAVYDAANELRVSYDQLNLPTSYSYDALGRRTTVQAPDFSDPNGDSTVFTYDAADHLTSQTDPVGLATTYRFDSLGRQVLVIYPQGPADLFPSLLRTTFDAANNPVRVIDLEASTLSNSTTSYDYDALNRRTGTHDPFSQTATVVYDAADHAVDRTDRDGRRVSAVYDALGRETSETWYASTGASLLGVALSGLTGVLNFWPNVTNPSPADQYTFAYDAADHRTAASNSQGSYQFTYDTLGRVQSSTDPFNLTLTYHYDALDHTVRRDDSQGGTVTATYDEAGRLTGRTLGQPGIYARVAYTYTNRNEVRQLFRYSFGPQSPSFEYFNGLSSYSYDAAGRVVGLEQFDATTTPQQPDPNNPTTATYTLHRFDNLTATFDHGRLSRDDSSFVDAPFTRVYNYTADSTSDPTTLLGAGLRWLHDSGYSYAYDQEGNLTFKIANTWVSNREAWVYSYDHAHRLVSAQQLFLPSVWTTITGMFTNLSWMQLALQNQGLEEDTRYDALGHRLGVTVTTFWGAASVSQNNYAYDGDQLWADLTPGNGLTARYLRGDGDGLPLAQLTPAGQVQWYWGDRDGNVRQVTDGVLHVVQYYQYSSNGVGTPMVAGATSDRWRGQGQEYDVSAKLTYRQGVHTDPATGRTLGADARKLATGDWNPTRNTGYGPTSIDNGGLPAHINNWLGGFVGIVNDTYGRPSQWSWSGAWDRLGALSDRLWQHGVTGAGKLMSEGITLQAQLPGLLTAGSAQDQLAAAQDAGLLSSNPLSMAWVGVTWLTGLDGSHGLREMTGLDRLRMGLRDFGAGAIDTLSLGLTRRLRKAVTGALDVGDAIDEQSAAYGVGSAVGAAGQAAIDVGLLLIPGVGEAAVAAEVGVDAAEGAALAAEVGEGVATAAETAAATAEGMTAAQQAVLAYRGLHVVGNAWNGVDALDHGDLLGAAMGALGALSAGVHFGAGGIFDVCGSKTFSQWAWKGVHGALLVGQGLSMGRQALEGNYLQAGFDGLMMMASPLMEMLRSCLGAGTPLRTPSGSKAVEAFREGDEVLTRREDDPSGPVVVARVEAVFERTGRVWHLQVRGKQIRTTGEHPWWAEGRGWTAASLLREGEQLLLEDGSWAAVEAVYDTREYEKVYNVRVAECHTYFVGNEEWGFSVWAHNAPCTVPWEDVRNGSDLRLTEGQSKWLVREINSRLNSGATTEQIGDYLTDYFVKRGVYPEQAADLHRGILDNVDPGNFYAEQASLALEAADGGHSIDRHGPGVSDALLQRRLTTGYAPDRALAPTTHSTRFSDYETWLYTREAALQKVSRDPAFNPTPGPNDQTNFRVLIDYGQEIGTGFSGRPGTNSRAVVGGRTITLWGAYDGPVAVTKVTTTVEWDGSQWLVRQHFPDAR